ESGILVPAGMVSVDFPDSAEGAAGTGADCAAAIPANSKAHIPAARIFMEGLPLQNKDDRNPVVVSDALTRAPVSWQRAMVGRRMSHPSLTATSPRPALQHIAHELRLQFLRTPLATNMHRAFLHRQFFVPRGEMHHRHSIIANRAPHHPPAVASAF